MEIKRTKTQNVKQILANTEHFFSVGAIIGNEGVTAENGKKIIKAGTPVGGATNTLQDSTTVLKVVSDASVQGVLMHDVDVTDGSANGTLLVWGFVNEFRLDATVVISAAVKTALDGKITFLKRNK